MHALHLTSVTILCYDCYTSHSNFFQRTEHNLSLYTTSKTTIHHSHYHATLFTPTPMLFLSLSKSLNICTCISKILTQKRKKKKTHPILSAFRFCDSLLGLAPESNNIHIENPNTSVCTHSTRLQHPRVPTKLIIV